MPTAGAESQELFSHTSQSLLNLSSLTAQKPQGKSHSEHDAHVHLQQLLFCERLSVQGLLQGSLPTSVPLP